MTAAASSPRQLSAENSQPQVNPWIVAVVVSIATFMEVLDTSIANVAVPHIAGGTASTNDEATWVLTSYLVANAVILPASGWLSTIIGRKRFYMGCVALFTISSFLCGIASSLPMLIVFRVFQGMGGGGLAPSEQSILADTFSPRQRGMAFALYGIVVVAAPAIGPTLGGWITDNYSWRWIFFINVPFGLISLALTHLVVHDPPGLVRERKRRLARGLRIDYVGFGLLALGLGCLQVVLDKGQEDDWFGSPFIVSMMIVSAMGLGFGIVWEFLEDQPILDLRMLSGDRTFAVSNLVMFAVGIVLFGTTIVIPLFAQEMLGYTAERAGMALTPGGLIVMALMPLVGFLLGKAPARYLVMLGMAISSWAIWRMTNFTLDLSFKELVIARILQASGLAFLFVPINTAAYASLKREKSNEASAILNLSRNLGGSVGISVVNTILARRSQFHQNTLAGHVTAFSPYVHRMMQGTSSLLSSHGGSSTPYSMIQATRMLYQTVLSQAQMLSYIDVFYVLSITCALLVPLPLLMKQNKVGAGAMAH